MRYYFCLIAALLASSLPAAERSNVILMMADDMGWGDVGYHGHPVLQTPHLDTMAREAIRFERFYAAAPVCSPTRGSCLTGRHPYRYGIYGANVGHLRADELSLAEFLKSRGYATGHFGKWHLGTLTRDVLDANRGGRKKNDAHYRPPWEAGFDVAFSTESKVPTYNPLTKPVKGARQQYWNLPGLDEPTTEYGTRYWTGPGQIARGDLTGDDSKLIMDRAIPFIRSAVERKTPFFAVVWFHAPHWPVVADAEHRALYSGLDDFHQNHFGCITALDEQVGRLRAELRSLNVADNTMLWFCSDNGPEGTAQNACGSAGPFRGRKRSLYEGGVRVPGLLEWPGRYSGPKVIHAACGTCDYFPTILAALSEDIPSDARRPIDGINLLPILDSERTERGSPIGFQSRKQQSWIDGSFKLYTADAGKTWELYDLSTDRGETTDLSQSQPERVQAMQAALRQWLASCKADDRRK